jgi:hypothetical protein
MRLENAPGADAARGFLVLFLERVQAASPKEEGQGPSVARHDRGTPSPTSLRDGRRKSSTATTIGHRSCDKDNYDNYDNNGREAAIVWARHRRSSSEGQGNRSRKRELQIHHRISCHDHNVSDSPVRQYRERTRSTTATHYIGSFDACTVSLLTRRQIRHRNSRHHHGFSGFQL